MKIYITTIKGELILVSLNLDKNTIKSYTKGGIQKLREYGWNIAKKESNQYGKYYKIMCRGINNDRF